MLGSGVVSTGQEGSKKDAYQSVDHQHCPCLIIVLALGDDIPQLPLGSIARPNLDRVQVRTEISRQFIDEETLPG